MTNSPELVEKYQQILLRSESGLKHSVVSSVFVKSPNLQGEQFSSTCKYITLSLNEGAETLELFVKGMPEKGFHSTYIKEWKLFEKEAQFFNRLLPDMQKFYMEKSGSKKPMDFFPTCFYADEKEIIMENLVKAKGYYLNSKAELQDFEHASKAVENYAQFHATGYAMIQEFGRDVIMEKYSSCLSEVLLNPKNPLMLDFFANTKKTVLNLLSSHKVPGHENALKILGKYGENHIERILDLVVVHDDDDDSKKGMFCTINHGDAWNNNMLFLRDQGTNQVKHHVLVDFQIIRCCSPNVDLANYLYSSLNTETRKQHLQQILEAYFNSLSRTAQLLTNSPFPFTLKEFMSDFKAKAILGFWMHILCVVVLDVMAQLDEVSNIENELASYFDQAITRWIEANPEIAREKAADVVDFCEEFEKFLEQF